MLVLTRRVGEAIVIGEAVSVTILQNHGGRVRLGIEAPDEVAVLRQEVRDRRSESPVATVAHCSEAPARAL